MKYVMPGAPLDTVRNVAPATTQEPPKRGLGFLDREKHLGSWPDPVILIADIPGSVVFGKELPGAIRKFVRRNTLGRRISVTHCGSDSVDCCLANTELFRRSSA